MKVSKILPYFMIVFSAPAAALAEDLPNTRIKDLKEGTRIVLTRDSALHERIKDVSSIDFVVKHKMGYECRVHVLKNDQANDLDRHAPFSKDRSYVIQSVKTRGDGTFYLDEESNKYDLEGAIRPTKLVTTIHAKSTDQKLDAQIDLSINCVSAGVQTITTAEIMQMLSALKFEKASEKQGRAPELGEVLEALADLNGSDTSFDRSIAANRQKNLVDGRIARGGPRGRSGYFRRCPLISFGKSEQQGEGGNSFPFVFTPLAKLSRLGPPTSRRKVL